MVQIPSRTFRTVVTLSAVAVATLVPGASASAASQTLDGDAAAVSELATDAAALLDREQQLLSDPTADIADLERVDADGAELLVRLDELDIDLSPAVRTTLARLPITGADERPLGPPAVIYAAAIDGLERIAATPAAVTPAAGDGGRGELVAIAMAAALALGLLVRATTRIPADDDRLDVVPLEQAPADLSDLDVALTAMGWNDELTGVATRTRLDLELAGGMNPAISTAAVVMIDLDHLGTLNDLHGRGQGDIALHRVAEMLNAEVSGHDVVYRYDGGQFCVLLIDAGLDDAERVADRIVTAARTIELPDASHVTVSAGVAAGAAGDVRESVELAERALLEAKVAGRDQARRAVFSAA